MQRLHAVHARHLDVEDGEVRLAGAEAVLCRRTIGIGHDAIAFGFECNRDRGQNVTVVVDLGDCGHEPAFRVWLAETASNPAMRRINGALNAINGAMQARLKCDRVPQNAWRSRAERPISMSV